MIGIRGFFTQRQIGTEDTIFTMKIDSSIPVSGTANRFVIPFTTNQTSFPLEIEWGDGNTDIITSYNQAETEHIYSTSGIYDISIKGTLDDRSFEFTNTIYGRRLIEIGGVLDITDGSYMFYGCSNLSQCDIISLDNLTSGYYMFRNNSLTSWTIPLPNLSNGMLMFQGNSLISWTVDLPNLTNGYGMFWDVNLTSWDIPLPNLTNGTNMFLGCTLNTTDYSNLLINLSSNNPNNNVQFHGGNSKYNSSAVSARSNLVSRGWSITDGGPE